MERSTAKNRVADVAQKQKPLSAFRLWCYDNTDEFVEKYKAYPSTDLETKMKTFWRHHTTQEEKNQYFAKEKRIKDGKEAPPQVREQPRKMAPSIQQQQVDRLEPIIESENTDIASTTVSSTKRTDATPFDPTALHVVNYATLASWSKPPPRPKIPSRNDKHLALGNDQSNTMGSIDMPVFF